ncbi:MAG: hypothetical protein HY365_00720 [Candidatus Aenigmarchaeota archaeon]|nr:hypothetical protein [Candidatus Aenigmarchaeota archaeon]
MDLNEANQYINEASKWVTRGSAVAGVSYVMALVIVVGRHALSKRIQSQAELEECVGEEKAKLGMTASVMAYLHSDGGAYCRKNGSAYEMHVGGRLGATRLGVRHELYHIHKGDTDKPYSPWKFNLIQEPRAAAYGAFGLKF